MDINEMTAAVEAILFAGGEPIEGGRLALADRSGMDARGTNGMECGICLECQ